MQTNTTPNPKKSPPPEDAIHPAQQVLNHLMVDSQRQFLHNFADSAAEVSRGIKACIHVIEDNPHYPANANHSTPKTNLNPNIPDYAALQQFAVTAAKLLADNARQQIDIMKGPRRPVVKRKLSDMKGAENDVTKTRRK